MKRQPVTAILVYGTQQKTKIESLTKTLVVDITNPSWFEFLVKEIKSDDLSQGLFLCLNQAYIIARKRISPQAILKIEQPEDILLEDEISDPPTAAVRIGDIVISQKFHPATEEAKAWLSTYHLDLIHNLFSDGFTVEILDEQNNLITTLGESK